MDTYQSSSVLPARYSSRWEFVKEWAYRALKDLRFYYKFIVNFNYKFPVPISNIDENYFMFKDKFRLRNYIAKVNPSSHWKPVHIGLDGESNALVVANDEYSQALRIYYKETYPKMDYWDGKLFSPLSKDTVERQEYFLKVDKLEPSEALRDLLHNLQIANDRGLYNALCDMGFMFSFPLMVCSIFMGVLSNF